MYLLSLFCQSVNEFLKWKLKEKGLGNDFVLFYTSNSQIFYAVSNVSLSGNPKYCIDQILLAFMLYPTIFDNSTCVELYSYS